jgi:hypothetical protein
MAHLDDPCGDSEGCIFDRRQVGRHWSQHGLADARKMTVVEAANFEKKMRHIIYILHVGVGKGYPLSVGSYPMPTP